MSTWATWTPIVIAAGALASSISERFGRRKQAAAEKDNRLKEAAELRGRLDRQQTANLGARQQECEAGADYDTYGFTIEDAGPAVARSVMARIVEFDNETQFADEVAAQHVKEAIGVGRDVYLTFRVPADLRVKHLELQADWDDDNERHRGEWMLHLVPPDDPPAYQARGFN